MKAIYLSTLIVAFGSLLYEFILAQTASSVLGSTVMQYNLTIGLFVGSLGLGSLCQHKIVPHLPRSLLFIWVEVLLAAVGAAAPFVILIADRLLSEAISASSLTAFSQLGTYLVTYCLVIVIGFLSGFELPLLMQMMSRFEMEGGTNKVLAVDYFGMVAAAVVFPFVILPHVDLFHMALALGILNAALATYWCLQSSSLERLTQRELISSRFIAGATLMTLLILFYYGKVLSQTVIRGFYIAQS